MKRFIPILIAVVVSMCQTSCSHRTKVIPRGKMSDIYMEMFLADQWVGRRPEYSAQVDTTLLYEPIFNKYGYTTEDYRTSIRYYIKDPERYARMLKHSVQKMDQHIRNLKKQRETMEKYLQMKADVNRFRPDRLFFLSGLENPDTFYADSLKYYVDSVGGGCWTFDPVIGYDTAFYGPKMVIWKELDSLSRADSTSVEPVVEEE